MHKQTHRGVKCGQLCFGGRQICSTYIFTASKSHPFVYRSKGQLRCSEEQEHCSLALQIIYPKGIFYNLVENAKRLTTIANTLPLTQANLIWGFATKPTGGGELISKATAHWPHHTQTSLLVKHVIPFPRSWPSPFSPVKPPLHTQTNTPKTRKEQYLLNISHCIIA